MIKPVFSNIKCPVSTKPVKRSLVKIAVLLVLSLPDAHTQTDTLSLAEAFELGNEHFAFRGSRGDYEKIAEIEADQLQLNYYPSFSLNAQASYQSDVVSLPFDIPQAPTLDLPHFRTQFNAQIEQIIYDGGITKARKQIKAISSTIEQQKLGLREESLHDQIAQLYFQILLLQNYRETLSNNLQLLDERKQSLAKAVDRGVAMEADVLQLEAEMIKMIQDTSQQHHQLVVLKEMLGELINFDLRSMALKLPDVEIDAGDTTIKDPQLEILTTQKERLALSADLSKAQNQPKVNAFVRAGLGYPNPFNLFDDSLSPFFNGGLQASWPIWDWGRHSMEKEVIQIQSGIIEREARQQKIRIRSGLEKISGEMLFLKDALMQDRELLNKRQRIRQLTELRLDRGLITTNEYLQAVNDEKLAELQLRRHQVELANAKVQYLLESGKKIKS